jgi:hypothetical protein
VRESGPRLEASPRSSALKYRATFTNPIKAGTSNSGPMTAANAAPELMPKTETATAMASSKLLLAAVNDKVAVFEKSASSLRPMQNETRNITTIVNRSAMRQGCSEQTEEQSDPAMEGNKRLEESPFHFSFSSAKRRGIGKAPMR